MAFAASTRRTHAVSARQTPEPGYDLAADYYDRWSWQSFWRENEFPIVRDRLLSAAPKHAVLDIGVGTGAFLAYVAPGLGREVTLTGVDVSGGMLSHARSRLGARAVLVQCDIRRGLPFRPGTFDAVLIMRVAS